MRWYRAYVGTTTDKKLGAIALRAGVSRSVVVASWHVILESAADANAGGECQCDEFDVSAALGEPLDAIQRVMVCFAEANIFRDGRVTAWRRRQYESDSSAERTKQWRDRNKTETRRPCDVTVTPPDTESDTDSESKKARARELAGEFEKFWGAYPKRKGSNRKSPAEKAFNSAVKSGALPAAIIAGAKKFAEVEAANIGTPYIPMAATWLNQRGWEEHQPSAADEARKRELYANMEAKGWRMIDGKWVEPGKAA